MNKEIILKNKIKEFRATQKMSQEELAKLTGTTRQTIIAIEKGQFNPSTKLALLICLALNCKFEELFWLE